jgi:hypothetical protein
MNTIADKWQDFDRQVVEGRAPPEHRRDLCLAFHAGALSSLVLVIENSRRESVSPEALDAMFAEWLDECATIAQTLRARGEL